VFESHESVIFEHAFSFPHKHAPEEHFVELFLVHTVLLPHLQTPVFLSHVSEKPAQTGTSLHLHDPPVHIVEFFALQGPADLPHLHVFVCVSHESVIFEHSAVFPHTQELLVQADDVVELHVAFLPQ